MNKKNITWEEIITFFSNYKNEEYNTKKLTPKAYCQKIIKNKKILTKNKMLSIFLIQTIIDGELDLANPTDINYESNLWRRYYITRDFYIAGDYLNLTFDYEKCDYEAWCLLNDEGFFDIIEEITKGDYIKYQNTADNMIDLSKKLLVGGLSKIIFDIDKQNASDEQLIKVLNSLDSETLNEKLQDLKEVLDFNNN